MRYTFDINPTRQLALVADAAGAHPYYVPAGEAPSERCDRAGPYLKQMHYVASHVCVGLTVMPGVIATGDRREWERLAEWCL